MKIAIRWVGIVFGLLVFAMLVLIGIGTTLPVKHSARCWADIVAPVDTVWTMVADPMDAGWRSAIARVEPAGTGEWREIDRYGHAITYQRVSEERDRHIVVRIADPALPFGGRWTYEFSDRRRRRDL